MLTEEVALLQASLSDSGRTLSYLASLRPQGVPCITDDRAGLSYLETVSFYKLADR